MQTDEAAELDVGLMPSGEIWIWKDYEIRLAISVEQAKQLLELLSALLKEIEEDADAT